MSLNWFREPPLAGSNPVLTTKNKIMIIIAAICFAIFFVEIHQFHRKWKLDFKPFSCTSCLAAWTGLALYLLPAICTDIIAFVFIPGVLAPLLSKLMWNLWK
jgi:hypothetical protein